YKLNRGPVKEFRGRAAPDSLSCRQRSRTRLPDPAGPLMRKLLLLTVAFVSLAWLIPAPAAIDPTAAAPPEAKQAPHLQAVHGETLADPYYWLREKGTPDVTAYLEAENAYTAALFRPLEPLRDKLYREILGRIQ